MSGNTNPNENGTRNAESSEHDDKNNEKATHLKRKHVVDDDDDEEKEERDRKLFVYFVSDLFYRSERLCVHSFGGNEITRSPKRPTETKTTPFTTTKAHSDEKDKGKNEPQKKTGDSRFTAEIDRLIVRSGKQPVNLPRLLVMFYHVELFYKFVSSFFVDGNPLGGLQFIGTLLVPARMPMLGIVEEMARVLMQMRQAFQCRNRLLVICGFMNTKKNTQIAVRIQSNKYRVNVKNPQPWFVKRETHETCLNLKDARTNWARSVLGPYFKSRLQYSRSNVDATPDGGYQSSLVMFRDLLDMYYGLPSTCITVRKQNAQYLCDDTISAGTGLVSSDTSNAQYTRNCENRSSTSSTTSKRSNDAGSRSDHCKAKEEEEEEEDVDLNPRETNNAHNENEEKDMKNESNSTICFPRFGPCHPKTGIADIVLANIQRISSIENNTEDNKIEVTRHDISGLNLYI